MEVWTCSVLFKTVKSLQILHYYSFLSLGFCSQHHGPNANRKIAEPPSELMCVAEYMIPRIILRLIQHLRINSIPSNAQMDKEAQWYIFFSFQIQLFSQSIIRFFFNLNSGPNVSKSFSNPIAFSNYSMIFHHWDLPWELWWQSASSIRLLIR